MGQKGYSPYDSRYAPSSTPQGYQSVFIDSKTGQLMQRNPAYRDSTVFGVQLDKNIPQYIPINAGPGPTAYTPPTVDFNSLPQQTIPQAQAYVRPNGIQPAPVPPTTPAPTAPTTPSSGGIMSRLPSITSFRGADGKINFPAFIAAMRAARNPTPTPTPTPTPVPSTPTQNTGSGYRPQFDPSFIQQMMAQRFGSQQPGAGVPSITQPTTPSPIPTMPAAQLMRPSGTTGGISSLAPAVNTGGTYTIGTT